jgi:phosphoribosylformylglycinamidine cyclo-ligase
MWRTFNCGIGYTLIVPRDAANATIAALEKRGLPAWTIGEIVPARGDERVHIV